MARFLFFNMLEAGIWNDAEPVVIGHFDNREGYVPLGECDLNPSGVFSWFATDIYSVRRGELDEISGFKILRFDTFYHTTHLAREF